MKSIFDRDEFVQYRPQWLRRQRVLEERASYYDGSVYTRMRNTMQVLGPKISGSIKPMFMPLSRAVDIDAGLLGLDWSFSQDEPRFRQWTEARDLLFDMSDWDVNGVLLVHYGAQYGLSGLRIADLRDKGYITITPVPPTKYIPLYSDNVYDKQPSAVIWCEQIDGGGEVYEYAEYITPETIRTFRDGEPYGYAGNDAEYPNSIGALPIFECYHINDGTEYGASTYERAMPLINEVNNMATHLADIIRRNAEPQAVIIGADPSELTRSGDVMWYLPSGASAEFLAPSIDVAGVLDFIREVREGVKEMLPELAWDEIRKNGQVASLTLEIQLQELVIKMRRIRPNYDRVLTYVMQLCGKLLPSLSALDDDELVLDTDRPVLPMSEADKIDIEMRQLELERMRNGTIAEGINA